MISLEADAAVAAAAPPAAIEVAVVIVNHGTASDAIAAARSVAAPGVALCVVDNSDDRGEARTLRRELATATVLICDNRGFGDACNRGIDRALATWPGLRHVLLLNPDARAEPDTLARLRACAARHPDAGIVGARVLSFDGQRTLFEAGRLRRLTLTRCHVRAPDTARELVTGFVTAACMLIDAQLLRRGLRFDPGYFLYVEDMDLCQRVRAGGRTLWVDRDAVVRHRDGGSHATEPPVLGTLRASQLYWMTRGKVRFARRWLWGWERAVFWTVALALKPLAGLLLARGTRFLRPYLRGLRDGLRG